MEYGTVPYVQHDLHPGDAIRETEPCGIELNPAPLGPQKRRQDGHRRAPSCLRLDGDQVQLLEQPSALMTARRRLTVPHHDVPMDSSVARRRIRSSDLPHLVTMCRLPHLTRLFWLHVTPGVTELAVRHVDIPGEAGQAHVGLVLAHLGGGREGLLNAPRPRAGAL